jgi:hypothetical protein
MRSARRSDGGHERPPRAPCGVGGLPATTSHASSRGRRLARSRRRNGETTGVAETAIEWATHVWNPTTGCDRVSPGCAHCYALDLAARLKRFGQPKYQRDGRRGSSGPYMKGWT